jgi:hypothetical protein
VALIDIDVLLGSRAPDTPIVDKPPVTLMHTGIMTIPRPTAIREEHPPG